MTMSENTEYNGWTNYETWAVKLWMDNDFGSYIDVRQMANEELVGMDRTPQTARILAGRLRAEYETIWADRNEERPADVFTDLMGRALERVNWDEIAVSLLNEMEEEAQHKV